MEMDVPRRRYIQRRTTITVDASLLEELRKLKRWEGEPLSNVVKRLLEHYKRTGFLHGY
jgi:predicted CopG family antitoxin